MLDDKGSAICDGTPCRLPHRKADIGNHQFHTGNFDREPWSRRLGRPGGRAGGVQQPVSLFLRSDWCVSRPHRRAEDQGFGKSLLVRSPEEEEDTTLGCVETGLLLLLLLLLLLRSLLPPGVKVTKYRPKPGLSLSER